MHIASLVIIMPSNTKPDTDNTACSLTMPEGDSENEKQYKTLSSIGYVISSSNIRGFAAVWCSGLQIVHFLQPTNGDRIKKGNIVHVTAEYDDDYNRYNATSVENLAVDINTLKLNISSVGVVVKTKPLILLDIATGLGVRLQDNELAKSTLMCQDLIHFSAVLDPDSKTQYKANFLCHSRLKSPQFGLVIKVPTKEKAGEMRTICNDSVMTVTVTCEHIRLPVKRLERVVFDADIDVDTMTLGVKSVEVLKVPSNLEMERKEAMGVIIEATGGEGIILDTTDFIGVLFNHSRNDLSVGCNVVYSAKLQDPSSTTYRATRLSLLQIQQDTNVTECQTQHVKKWEKEAVEHLKERLEYHESIPMRNLSGHWQQTSEAVRKELKDEEKCRKFLARHSRIFTISKTDEITLCRNEPDTQRVENQPKTNADPQKGIDLEQEAVNYLVKCLEKHKLVQTRNLSGYLSQASHEVQKLLNFDPDQFLEKYSCFFKVSDSGAISLRSVGKFTIPPDLNISELSGGFMDVPSSTGSSGLPKSKARNLLKDDIFRVAEIVPQVNKWDSGKTVDKLFGPSSQTSPRQGKTPSQPVKLLEAWEVSARQFIVKTLQKYEQIYLMNLHSHLQYAPEHVKTRLRGQDVQRRFLQAHQDLFRLDDSDLITLSRSHVDSYTDEIPKRTEGKYLSVTKLDEGCVDICLPQDSEELQATRALAEDTTGSVETKCTEYPLNYVRLITEPTWKVIAVTKLDYDALEYIAAKFEKHGEIERRKIFGHFAQASPSVKPVYSNPQRVDKFISKFPDIFKERDGYLTMTPLYFPNTGEVMNMPTDTIEEMEKPVVQTPVYDTADMSEPDIGASSGEKITGARDDHTESKLECLRCVTVLGSTNHDILVTQLEYDALNYIASRFKMHGTIERSKLFGQFGQSPDHVKMTYQNRRGAESLVEKFPEVFVERQGYLTMAKLGFAEVSTDEDRLGTLLRPKVHQNQKETESEQLKDCQLNASISNCSEVIDGDDGESDHDSAGWQTTVDEWEIEAKAFIASKLVKHKCIYLRNLHSHFAGAPRSMLFKLVGQDKQREFLARHAEFFSIDEEDVITLVDRDICSINSLAQSTDSLASSGTRSVSTESQHAENKEFVGVGQITNLFPSQTGLVKDIISGEVIRITGKTAGFKNVDLLSLFEPDSFVAFKAGPRATGVMYPNGILNMTKVDDTDVKPLKVVIEILQNSGPMSLQDLANDLRQTDEEFQGMVTTVKTLEQFLSKHSILFNVYLGSVSLRCQEKDVKPSVGAKGGEKWFKAIIQTRNGKKENYVKKSEFLVMQHVRNALQKAGNKVEFSKLHELFLESPGPESHKLKTLDQAQRFVQKHPDIFQVDGDKVSMAKVTFTQRKEEIPEALQTQVQGSSSSASMPEHASISSRNSTQKTKLDREELIAGSAHYASDQHRVDKHQVSGNEDRDDHQMQDDVDLVKKCRREQRVVSVACRSYDEMILLENSSASSAESYKDEESTVSGSTEALPMSAAGIGKVISLYPRNGLFQDVFTDDIIILLHNLIKEEWTMGDSLADHFSVDDFVEYDSVERVNASKYKRGVVRIQKIQATDLEYVSRIVKCLREVESMTIDALLVYLNDASDHSLSQPCTKEILMALIKKYNLIFDETDGIVMLMFEVSEDALEWTISDSCLQPQNSSFPTGDDISRNVAQDSFESRQDIRERNARTETSGNNQDATSEEVETENTNRKQQEGQNPNTKDEERQPASEKNECTPVAMYHKPPIMYGELVIDDDLEDLENWDSEEYLTIDRVFVPHLTEESLNSYVPASHALDESGISATSLHSCTELNSEDISSSALDVATNEDVYVPLPKPINNEISNHAGTPQEEIHSLDGQLDFTTELHPVSQNHDHRERSEQPCSSGGQTGQLELPANSTIQDEASFKEPLVEPVVTSDSTVSSSSYTPCDSAVSSLVPPESFVALPAHSQSGSVPVLSVEPHHQSRSPSSQTAATRPTNQPHPDLEPCNHQPESSSQARHENSSDEASLVWENHLRLRSTLSRGVSEGFGTIRAVVSPAVMVLMENNQVGVFMMPVEQCIVPKLDSRVRYMARRVDSEQMRWAITDLFFEHHIISAFGSGIESNSVDVGVQTTLTGHVIGCNVFEQ